MDLLPWAHQIAQNLLADSLPQRWQHVQAVAHQATRWTPFLGEDGDLLIASALLHDVGYAAEAVDTGLHHLDGARLLQRYAAPIRLINLVACHSAAHVEAEFRGLSNELMQFPDEQTPLRDALWCCDLTTTPEGRPTTVEDRLAEVEKRYGPVHFVTKAIQQARPEMVKVTYRALNWLDQQKNASIAKPKIGSTETAKMSQ